MGTATVPYPSDNRALHKKYQEQASSSLPRATRELELDAVKAQYMSRKVYCLFFLPASASAATATY